MNGSDIWTTCNLVISSSTFEGDGKSFVPYVYCNGLARSTLGCTFTISNSNFLNSYSSILETVGPVPGVNPGLIQMSGSTLVGIPSEVIAFVETQDPLIISSTSITSGAIVGSYVQATNMKGSFGGALVTTAGGSISMSTFDQYSGIVLLAYVPNIVTLSGINTGFFNISAPSATGQLTGDVVAEYGESYGTITGSGKFVTTRSFLWGAGDIGSSGSWWDINQGAVVSVSQNPKTLTRNMNVYGTLSLPANGAGSSFTLSNAVINIYGTIETTSATVASSGSSTIYGEVGSNWFFAGGTNTINTNFVTLGNVSFSIVDSTTFAVAAFTAGAKFSGGIAGVDMRSTFNYDSVNANPPGDFGRTFGVIQLPAPWSLAANGNFSGAAYLYNNSQSYVPDAAHAGYDPRVEYLDSNGNPMSTLYLVASGNFLSYSPLLFILAILLSFWWIIGDENS